MLYFDDDGNPDFEATGTNPLDGSFWILGYPVASSPTSATVTLTIGSLNPNRTMTVYANAINILYTKPFGGVENPDCSEE